MTSPYPPLSESAALNPLTCPTENWTQARHRAWARRKTAPVPYLLSYPPPPYNRLSSKWTLDEHLRFLSALQLPLSTTPADARFAAISLLVPGRVGADVRKYYHRVGRAGLIFFSGKVRRRLVARARVKEDDQIVKSKNVVFLRRNVRKFVPETLPVIDDAPLRRVGESRELQELLTYRPGVDAVGDDDNKESNGENVKIVPKQRKRRSGDAHGKQTEKASAVLAGRPPAAKGKRVRIGEDETKSGASSSKMSHVSPTARMGVAIPAVARAIAVPVKVRVKAPDEMIVGSEHSSAKNLRGVSRTGIKCDSSRDSVMGDTLHEQTTNVDACTSIGVEHAHVATTCRVDCHSRDDIVNPSCKYTQPSSSTGVQVEGGESQGGKGTTGKESSTGLELDTVEELNLPVSTRMANSRRLYAPPKRTRDLSRRNERANEADQLSTEGRMTLTCDVGIASQAGGTGDGRDKLSQGSGSGQLEGDGGGRNTSAIPDIPGQADYGTEDVVGPQAVPRVDSISLITCGDVADEERDVEQVRISLSTPQDTSGQPKNLSNVPEQVKEDSEREEEPQGAPARQGRKRSSIDFLLCHEENETSCESLPKRQHLEASRRHVFAAPEEPFCCSHCEERYHKENGVQVGKIVDEAFSGEPSFIWTLSEMGASWVKAWAKFHWSARISFSEFAKAEHSFSGVQARSQFVRKLLEAFVSIVDDQGRRLGHVRERKILLRDFEESQSSLGRGSSVFVADVTGMPRESLRQASRGIAISQIQPWTPETITCEHEGMGLAELASRQSKIQHSILEGFIQRMTDMERRQFHEVEALRSMESVMV